MESRISVISMIIEDVSVSVDINTLLHQYSSHIIGRLGLPYRERGVAILCVILDAPGDVTSSLSGKLGMIHGVSVKTITSKNTGSAPEQNGATK